RERYRSGRDERDALVSGPEEHVELQPRVHERCGVALSEDRRGFPVAEEPGVEEIRTVATGLEPETAEPQGFARDRELDEPELVILHALFRRDRGDGAIRCARVSTSRGTVTARYDRARARHHRQLLRNPVRGEQRAVPLAEEAKGRLHLPAGDEGALPPA